MTAAAVTGINFRGGGPNLAAGGIRLQKASWCAVKVAQFDNFADEAIVITSGMACTIEDILTTNVLLNRARPKLAGAITIAGTDHYLNRIEANTSLHALSGAPTAAHHRRLPHSRCQSFHQQLRRRDF